MNQRKMFLDTEKGLGSGRLMNKAHNSMTENPHPQQELRPCGWKDKGHYSESHVLVSVTRLTWGENYFCVRVLLYLFSLFLAHFSHSEWITEYRKKGGNNNAA